MIELEIPGRGVYRLHTLALDVNGTLAKDGELIEGVANRIRLLQEDLEVVLLTADTHGRQATIDATLGLSARRISPGQEASQKAAFVTSVGAEGVIAMGNGANDAGMLRAAALGVAVVGPEGCSRDALDAADMLVYSIQDALDMLIYPRRMIATLRT